MGWSMVRIHVSTQLKILWCQKVFEHTSYVKRKKKFYMTATKDVSDFRRCFFTRSNGERKGLHQGSPNSGVVICAHGKLLVFCRGQLQMYQLHE